MSILYFGIQLIHVCTLPPSVSLMPTQDSIIVIATIQIFHQSHFKPGEVHSFIMRQTRLDRYFASPDASLTHPQSRFLGLPFNIRCQIYYAAGLLPNHYIDLNYWALSKTVHEFADVADSDFRVEAIQLQRQREVERLDRHTSTALCLPIHLLLVCRVIHHEVTSLVYGLNTFAISPHEPGGLGALEKLGVSALKELRILIVKLNDCSPLRYRRSTLGGVSRADRRAVEQWRRICMRLSAYVPPLQLRLCLICDCSDWQTVREVANISSALPVLQDCAIRFFTRPVELLKQLARQTALRLTAQKEPALNPFPFLNLPKELQLRILEYTNLVASTALEWSPDSPLTFGPSTCTRPTNETSATGTGLEFLGWELFPSIFLCSTKVSAFNSHCTCERFTRSYFLINREFRNLATEIFYSCNRFVILHKGRDFSNTLSEARSESLPLLTYLTSIPTGAIGHLIRLTLIFPPFEPSYLQSSQGDGRVG
ncbi:hypothetical protein OIDMADRAFT_61009 [Oidiodendron maius Zn]|uniref:DUF7730 domain-containing protein n=1 Tax=Oidiodendron maius (strain Zn) TaxID=913774 RepID=A0A0C3CWW2_OIDMZ|nr:hypothetical protein OIDMADRAFT_61009 [Oidiodendron maius Zn]